MNSKSQRIVEFMEVNLRRKLTLDEMAQSVGLSRSRVCSLFKSESGMSPGQYLKLLRAEKARELLETTALSVKEIMATVGIQDQSHFFRDFKNRYGVTPAKYREHHTTATSSKNQADKTAKSATSFCLP